MIEETTHVGILYVSVFIGSAQSLNRDLSLEHFILRKSRNKMFQCKIVGFLNFFIKQSRTSRRITFCNGKFGLKQKRMAIKWFKDKLRSKFNVSVAGLGSHDKWQIAVLWICMIGGDSRYIDSCLQNILSFIDRYHAVDISDYRIEFV